MFYPYFRYSESPTKARREGQFHESQEDKDVSAPPNAGAIVELPSVQKPLADLTFGDLGIQSRSGDTEFETVFERDLSFDSATNDYLPNIPFGKRTLLSAREYAHWSYFQRIQQRISMRWTHQIQTAVVTLAAVSKNVTAGEKLTRVLVELDRDGVVEDVSVVRSSGSRTLDGVALKVFREVRSFPNPPQVLLRTDGTIRLRWTFVVNVKPKIGVATVQKSIDRRFD